MHIFWVSFFKDFTPFFILKPGGSEVLSGASSSKGEGTTSEAKLEITIWFIVTA
mgnify:CR=1 FL=1